MANTHAGGIAQAVRGILTLATTAAAAYVILGGVRKYF
jgi:hypothetical protein